MRIERLNHFIEVATQGSISKASKQLFISQPSLSTSITNLEEELGIKLFHRMNKGVSLTTQGKEVLELAKNITRDLGKIKLLASHDEQLSGNIPIAAIPGSCNSLVLELIISLKKLYPNLHIQVNEVRPNQVVRQLLKREVKLGISSYLHTELDDISTVLSTKRIKMEHLYQDELCVFVSKDHPFAQRSSITLNECKQYPFASFYEHILDNDIQDRPSSSSIINELDITYRFNDRESIKKIVSENIALTLLPKRMTLNDLYVHEGHIVPIPLSGINLQIDTFLLYEKDTLLSLEEQKIIDMLKAICLNYST